MPTVKVERPAMGSLVQIFLEGNNPDALESLGYDALARVDWLEQQLSYFLPDSDISQINSLAYKESVPLAPNVTALLARCRHWYDETDGAFDITSAKLSQFWVVISRQVVRGDTVTLPSAERIAKIVPHIGWKFVELDEANHTIRFHSSEVRLNLGAVGKGYVVQAVAEYLRSQGIEAALVHSGYSSVVALGSPANADSWNVKVTDSTSVPHAALKNAALSVSSNRESFVTVDGERYGHLFDPRTGLPIETLAQVAVVADDAADAEALSTAFLVNGVAWTQAYIEKYPEFAALFLDENNVSYQLFNGNRKEFVENCREQCPINPAQ